MVRQAKSTLSQAKSYSFPALGIFLGLCISTAMFLSYKPKDDLAKSPVSVLSTVNHIVHCSSVGLTFTYAFLMVGTIWHKQRRIQQHKQQLGDNHEKNV